MLRTAREQAGDEVFSRLEQAFSAGDASLATRLDTFLRTIESMSDEEFTDLSDDPVPGSFVSMSYTTTIPFH
jgi:hypothetical protein